VNPAVSTGIILVLAVASLIWIKLPVAGAADAGSRRPSKGVGS
jgi:hypothetical protein